MIRIHPIKNYSLTTEKCPYCGEKLSRNRWTGRLICQLGCGRFGSKKD